MSNDKIRLVPIPGSMLHASEDPWAHDLTIEDRKKMGLPHLHVYKTDQELKDIIFQTEADANRVFFCANEWLVRFGQDQARVWGKNGIKLQLCAPCDRIAEPETYADIRKD